MNVSPLLLLLTVILCSVSNPSQTQSVCTAMEVCVGPNSPINGEFPALIGHHDEDQHWLLPFGYDI